MTNYLRGTHLQLWALAMTDGSPAQRVWESGDCRENQVVFDAAEATRSNGSLIPVVLTRPEAIDFVRMIRGQQRAGIQDDRLNEMARKVESQLDATP
jgi:hypothetical protein